MKQNGIALSYTLAELKGDREIVLEAVKSEGKALQYASADLKGDRDFILEAVMQAGPIVLDITSLPEEIRNDLGLKVEALRDLIKAKSEKVNLQKAQWVKEDQPLKDQLEVIQKKNLKHTIWETLSGKSDLGDTVLENIADHLKPSEAAKLAQTCLNEETPSNKLKK